MVRLSPGHDTTANTLEWIAGTAPGTADLLTQLNARSEQIMNLFDKAPIVAEDWHSQMLEARILSAFNDEIVDEFGTAGSILSSILYGDAFGRLNVASATLKNHGLEYCCGQTSDKRLMREIGDAQRAYARIRDWHPDWMGVFDRLLLAIDDERVTTLCWG